MIGEHDARSGAAVAELYGWSGRQIHHVSLREAEREWTMTRAWLRKRLDESQA